MQDIEITVCSDEFTKLGYHSEAVLTIQPRRGRYFATFGPNSSDGEDYEMAHEPAEPELQKLGIEWAINNPEDAVLKLMHIHKGMQDSDW